MAEQLRKTKCKTDIYQLFTSAREHMKNNGSGYQVPEFRSTLLPPLCLPVATQVRPEENMTQPQLISDDIQKRISPPVPQLDTIMQQNQMSIVMTL